MSALIRIKSQFSLAYKSLKSAPGFVASVILTMSLTLATLFVTFSLVNAYFFKPLNVLDEKNLYVVEQETSTITGVRSGFQSYKSIVHWYKTQSSFDKLTPVSLEHMMFTNLPGEPKVVVTFATPDYYDIFNVPIILGQNFSLDLKLEQASDEVMISEKFWQKHFNKDPNVIGKTLNDGQRLFKIIGVIADTFEPPYMFYEGQSELWMHFSSDRRFLNKWDNSWGSTFKELKLVGTANTGTTRENIFTDLKRSIDEIRAEWLTSDKTSTDLSPIVTAYRIVELGDKGHLSLFLLAGTLGLLLIAVVNVCNLFFSRALAQHKNLVLQAVLGAKRSLLFTAIFAQTLLLMIASMLIALFISAWGVKLFKHLAAGKLPLVQSISVDTNLFMIALLLSIALAYIFALVTSRLVNFKELRAQLQSSGKGSVNQVSGRTVRILVSVQMALASTLIIFACLALSKTTDTLSRPVGSKTTNMYYVQAFIPGENQVLSIAERFDKNNKIQANLTKQTNIKQVSGGTSPLSLRVTRATLTDMQGNRSPFFPQAWVGADYFEHTGLKIIKGRTFSDAALRGEKKEVMITRSLAFHLEPSGDVLGKIYDGFGPKNEIVGITEDFNHPNFYDQDKGAHIWWAKQHYTYNFIVETKPGVTFTQEKFLSILRKEDARFHIWEFSSLEDELSRITYMDTITLYLSYILAGFTLLLASVGIYGVLSYNLGLRRFEFGIRMALGAKKVRLYKLLVKDAIAPLMIGLSCAILITIIIFSQYYEALSLWLTFDLKFALPALILTLGVALLASFRPMQKIIKESPVKALRNE